MIVITAAAAADNDATTQVRAHTEYTNRTVRRRLRGMPSWHSRIGCGGQQHCHVIQEITVGEAASLSLSLSLSLSIAIVIVIVIVIVIAIAVATPVVALIDKRAHGVELRGKPSHRRCSLLPPGEPQQLAKRTAALDGMPKCLLCSPWCDADGVAGPAALHRQN